jgi:hypothetical protein
MSSSTEFGGDSTTTDTSKDRSYNTEAQPELNKFGGLREGAFGLDGGKDIQGITKLAG